MTGFFTAGILYCRFNRISLSILIVFSAIIMLHLFVSVVNKKREIPVVLLSALVCVLIFVFAKQLSYKSEIPSQTEKFIGENGASYVTVRARICDLTFEKENIRLKADIISLSGNENDILINGREYIYVYADKEYEYGDIVEFSSELCLYSPAINDGEADMKSYYAARNVCCYAKPDQIRIIKKNNSLAAAVNNTLIKGRKYFSGNINDALDGEEAELITAMLDGEKSRIDRSLRESFSDAGFSHILAISGLHISMLAAMIVFLLKAAGAGKNTSTISVMLFLCLYSVFCGMQVSVIRAVIMLSFSLAAKRTGKQYDALTALCVAAMLVLSKQPLMLFDASFVLSFSAAFFAFFINGFLKRTGYLIKKENIKKNNTNSAEDNKITIFMKKAAAKAGKAFFFAFFMQILLLPLQLYYFYSFCPYSLLLNVLLLPLMSVLLFFGIICGIGGSSLAYFCAYPVSFIIRIYISACSIAVSLPFGKTVCGRPTALMIAGYYFMILLLVCACFLAGKAKIMAFSLLVPLIFIMRKHRGTGFYQLYTGQGDCGIILHDDKAVMIDCGSSDRENIYKYTVEKFLNYHGFVGPDMIFLSHADADHTNGALEFLEEYAAEKNDRKTTVFLPELKDMSGFGGIITMAEYCEDTDVIFLSEGQKISNDKAEFVVLYPDTEHNEVSENDTSMVLYVRAGDITALYTGDISSDIENLLPEKMSKYGLDEDINLLKVAHHGSRNSSGEEFLEIIRPDIAFVSAGKDNSYGHPAEETLNRLSEAGCEIHSTKEEGMLSFTN